MKEENIRKRETFNQYLKLVRQDARKIFDLKRFKKIPCPACGERKTQKEFEKNGFNYVSCRNCQTLFANPRPCFGDLDKFYRDSVSTKYWVEQFFRPVMEIRRKEIFRPRAEYAAALLKDPRPYIIGDVGAGFGIFLEELQRLRPQNTFVAIEPSSDMADICRRNGFEVLESCLEDVQGQEGRFDLMTVFELAEHLHDPLRFFSHAHNLLKPGGYLLLTILNGQGFDIQVLWDKSKSIFPPHHLNFFNPRSLEILLQRLDFQAIEVSTPGQLDWDIVEGMMTNEGVAVDRFWKVFQTRGTPEAKAAFQKWLSTYQMSSHMRVLACRKKIA